MTEEEKARIRQQNQNNVHNPRQAEYDRRESNAQEGSEVRYEHLKKAEDSMRKAFKYNK